MKSLLLLAFTFILFTANATTYYFSTSGNDANSGTSTSAPWKTLNKFNSAFATKSAGDKFLFNRGNIFYGHLVITKSGSATLPMTIGAYGTGADPVITGFTTVTGWTNLGSNIWESTAAVSTRPTCNMVVVNGVNTAMGRTPNYPDYYNWDTHTGNTSIKDAALPSSPNWKGAELAIFTTTYKVARHPITAQSAGTISFTSTGDLWQSAPGYFLQQFFIQNDARTLDVQNEWYYNPSTKKLRIFSSSTPANVQVATVDTLVWTGINHDNISIDNISFTGANFNAIDLGNGKNLKVTNCDINFAGQNGFFAPSWGQDLPGLKIENCTFNHINNCGIDVSRWFRSDTIRYNAFKNIGMLVGMAAAPSSSLGIGIFSQGAGGLISYNTTDSTGQAGIRWRGSNTIVNNNFVQRFCMGNGVKDGGGIYTFNTGDSTMKGSKVINNIILNAGSDGRGIYFDEHSNGAEVYGNTISGTLRGIYLHNAWDMNVHHNTAYDNFAVGLMMVADDPSVSMTHITIKNNIFVAKTVSETPVWTNMLNVETMPLPFTSDSNYFARPIDDNFTIQTYLSPEITQRDLAGWQSLNHQDAHTKKSPKTITNIYDLRLEYNNTTSNKTISLDANYIDVKNVSYNGTITLAPYTSAVLIRNGEATTQKPNQSPVANAGADQTITLPTSTVSLSGSGTDADGTITTYGWTKISGPSAGAITKAGTAATTVTGMVSGTYQFTLKITDNKGDTAVNTVQVVVNSAVNQLPTVSAGGDQTITASTATLNGSATDDGNVASYAWTQKSGPAATIVSPASVSTSLTGLVSGTYQFQLKVTDNKGGIATDATQITVSDLLPAVNPANTVNGLDYSYYESATAYSAVPDFSSLTPVKTGAGAGFDISVANNPNRFSFDFSGFINVPSDGQYTFYTTSDDGSKLYIDNVPVVNNDGVHSAAERSGTIGLKAGKHAISVGYFQQTGRTLLTVSYAGPGISKKAIPASALYRVSEASSSFVAMNNNNISQVMTSSLQVKIQVYPNPFVDYIKINITDGIAGEYKLMLIDVSGKVLWTKSGIKNTGALQESVNASNLTGGIYFLKVIQNNITKSVIKLVK